MALPLRVVDHPGDDRDRLASAALAGRAQDVAAKGLRVREDRIDGSAWVWGSRTLLRRAVDNMVDNAITHNETGGRISVAVRAGGDEAGAVPLVVESGGPVLDQRRVADLARPFRRLGADRTGTGRGSGLGLSITVTVTVSRLRRKLGDPPVIATTPGVGYRIADAAVPPG
ncbi:ATP-binding protein [Streptomyces similanensis]|uniref:Sensor-like histidine kinase SenX3 n=1 Tax=Streptomyces similanensis TaxID=1274988 RepID=A0ABP9KTB4_9ACTN